MATIIALKVNGTEYKIDVELETFTAGELNAVELHTRMKWHEWFRELGNRNVSSLAWTALAWVAVRRAGVFAPFDEFGDSIKLLELIASADPEEVAAAATVASKRKPRER